MQRALIIIVMVALVIVAITAGALAAHWPFWQRAWQWHVAAVAGPEKDWPEKLHGPTRVLQPAEQPTPLSVDVDPLLLPDPGSDTTLLLVAGADGRTRAHFAAGVDARTPVDGRELSNALLVLLYGALMQSGRKQPAG